MIRIALGRKPCYARSVRCECSGRTDQLVKGSTDTSNVLNYGMGYNLQRYSPLTQINKGQCQKPGAGVELQPLPMIEARNRKPLVYKRRHLCHHPRLPRWRST